MKTTGIREHQQTGSDSYINCVLKTTRLQTIQGRS